MQAEIHCSGPAGPRLGSRDLLRAHHHLVLWRIPSISSPSVHSMHSNSTVWSNSTENTRLFASYTSQVERHTHILASCLMKHMLCLHSGWPCRRYGTGILRHTQDTPLKGSDFISSAFLDRPASGLRMQFPTSFGKGCAKEILLGVGVLALQEAM